jgi:hypothetical protein
VCGSFADRVEKVNEAPRYEMNGLGVLFLIKKSGEEEKDESKRNCIGGGECIRD